MSDGYPTTFLRVPPNVPEIFDPALQHFRRAFRQGEPVFDDEATAAQWRQDRRVAMEAVLAVLADRAPNRVVLRGSVLNQVWLPKTAREPHDIDLIVMPPTLGPEEAEAEALMNTLRAGLCGQAAGDRVRFSPLPPPIDAIWTYVRAEGRRLVFPWSAVDGPPGVVQVDLVFREALPVLPRPVEIPRRSGPPIKLLGVTPELALAWKILWLTWDQHGQGKDLVDAVLLAEHCRPDVALINHLLNDGEETADDIERLANKWIVEWEHYEAEYGPGVGPMEGWIARLVAAWDRLQTP